MEFKDRLKKYRIDNNLTQEDLAKKLCVSRQAVSKYETGLSYPNLDVMRDISKLLGVTLDELLSKEEIAKETITANINRQKNKRNVIILAIAIVLVVVISITAIIFAVKFTAQLPDERYLLVGMVGALNEDTDINMQSLQDGKLFGYCFTYNDGVCLGKGYNLSTLHTNLVGFNYMGKDVYDERKTILATYADIQMNCSFDLGVLVSAEIEKCQLYAVYYDSRTEEYVFKLYCNYNVPTHGVVRVELNNQKQRWTFAVNFKSIDTLNKFTLYEYDINSVLINSVEINGEETYSVSDNCMYIVIEQNFTDANGHVYNYTDVVLSAKIDKVMYYPIPMLNANGYGTTSLALRK